MHQIDSMSADLDNLERLNRELSEYMKYTKQTVAEAIAKQGTKLSFALAKRLKKEAPGKGVVRSERLAALKSGGGIAIRESVRNKITKGNRSLNRQALRVRRELNLREQGKGFMAYGVRVNTRSLARGSGGRVHKVGRARQLLATAGLRFNPDSARVEFEYGSVKSELGTTLGKPRFRKHINAALGEVADDIRVYLDRKLSEANR
jgi:hypothetical protein